MATPKPLDIVDTLKRQQSQVILVEITLVNFSKTKNDEYMARASARVLEAAHTNQVALCLNSDFMQVKSLQ